MLLLAAAIGACAGQVGEDESPITGTIVDGDGEPAAGVEVKIGDAITTTDADGRFLAKAGPHYDVAFAVAKRAYVYQGLSSRSPTLKAFGVAMSLKTHGATIEAKAPAEGHERVVFVPCANVADLVASDDGMLGVRWLGAPSAEVELAALRYKKDSTGIHWTGYARSKVHVEHLGAATWNVELAPVEEETAEARVSVQPLHKLEWLSVSIDMGGKSISAFELPASAALRLPRVEGARFRVEAVARGQGGMAIASRRVEAGKVKLDLPRSPALKEGLAWEGPNEVHWAYLGSKEQTSGVWIATRERQLRLPDLRPLGVELPRGVFYVVEARGARTVEEAAARGVDEAEEGDGGATLVRPLRD
jgi:hypothetical protein